MKIFPDEYRMHITALHKLTVVIAGILIAGTLLGMPAFLLLRGADLPLNTRKLLAILIMGGAPAGLILISTVNYSLGRRYRQHLLDLQPSKRGSTLPHSREDLLKRMPYTQYDYHNARQSFKLAVIVIAIIYIVLIAWLYLAFAPLQPAALLALCFPFVLLTVRWLPNSRRWQGRIILTEAGLQIEKDGQSQVLPWDSLTEIKDVKQGYSVRSNLSELVIWNEISPPALKWTRATEMFRLGEMYSRQLVSQIKTMNPAIVHIEPYLTRKLQIPISDRTIAAAMIIIISLFVIFMVITRPETVGR